MTAVAEVHHPGDPLTRLRGIGPRSAEALADEGLRTVLDLLLHLPRRYEDRTQITSLESPLEAGSWVLLRGRVTNVRLRRVPRRRLVIVDGSVDDGFGTVKVVWFNQRWIHRRLAEEPELYLFGQVRESRGGDLQLLNPEIEEVVEDVERIVPIYRRVGRFGGRRLRRLVAQCVPTAALCEDPLPTAVRSRWSLPILSEALRELHTPVAPDDPEDRRRFVDELNSGRSSIHRRLAFDELLAFACTMESRRADRLVVSGPIIGRATLEPNRVRSLLPFSLTDAQQRVLTEIFADLASGAPMARLLQGDVGSGKTVIAALAMLAVLESGHQVAFMAPTELLAQQHANTFEAILGAAGQPTARLMGSQAVADQRQVRNGLEDGSVHLVIGTHALFQGSVVFDDLGMVVVDEQHRFGVAQRHALVAKGRAPHLLVMTATPIPRSLALTVYGDLELSILDEMPPGRRPVATHLRFGNARAGVFDFVRKEIEDGGRVFIVYPAIDPTDEIEAAALTDHEERVREALPGVAIEVLHSRLDRDRREEAIARFRDGSVQVLLATTIVEVGVDVPEASVMVVESAQRFGLSQLHQLRGRVGRGDRQAWCILMADDDLGEDARRRLEAVCATNDGFEIAEADLELRGPGELTGTRQWGPAGFRFADLFRDRDLITVTREIASASRSAGSLDGLLGALGRYHRVNLGWGGD